MDTNDSLYEIAARNNLQMEYDEGLSELEKDTFIYFYNNDLSPKWKIVIGADKHTGSEGVFYGISYRYPNRPHITKKKLSGFSNFWEEGEISTEYPFGWAYLRGTNGQGNWWNWSDVDTLKDMLNGKLAGYIETEIIRPVISNKLLEKAEEITEISRI